MRMRGWSNKGPEPNGIAKNGKKTTRFGTKDAENLDEKRKLIGPLCNYYFCRYVDM